MVDHTPEPWFSSVTFEEPPNPDEYETTAEFQEVLKSKPCKVRVFSSPLMGGGQNPIIADIYGWDPERDPQLNAKRVVATINACAGLSTSALEQDVVKELVVACRMAREELVFGGDWETARAKIDAALAKLEVPK